MREKVNECDAVAGKMIKTSNVTVAEKMEGRVLPKKLNRGPHHILTCHWVNAFLQSALSSRSAYIFSMSGP